MKNLYIYITLVFSLSAFAQNGNVGIGTTIPDPSAALDMVSNNQGLLVNRVALSDVTDATAPVNTPANGLLVYNTNAAVTGGSGEGFYYFNGTIWVKIVGGAPGWELTGNAGTIAGTNFLGTTNSQDLILSTAGVEAIRVLANGNIGIGTNNPTAMFHAEGVGVPGTVYSMDFEGDLSTVTQTSASGGGSWATTGALPLACDVDCNGNVAYINGSAEDDTLYLGTFTPIQNSINISFDYGVNDDGTGGAKGDDSFHVALFQAGLQVGADIINIIDTDAYDQQIINVTRAVIGGLPYEIRITFRGGIYGVVDNFLITQTAIPVMRIEDGNEQAGYVLTSDADGFATWKNPTTALAEDDWQFFTGNTINDPMYHKGLVRAGTTTLPTRTLNIDYGFNGRYTNTTSFGIGSVEMFIKYIGANGIEAGNNDIASQFDNSATLGSAALTWTEVFITNPIINTSDERLKENMKPIQYGIEDVMKLRPSQYYWKDKHYIERGVPLAEKNLKLGLIAQELLEVIPEVVTTHQWVKKSEKENKTYVLKENERLGVNYAELIPVLVKATQDQQVLIEKLKAENKRLELLAK